jgi:hypothetical protein
MILTRSSKMRTEVIFDFRFLICDFTTTQAAALFGNPGHYSLGQPATHKSQISELANRNLKSKIQNPKSKITWGRLSIHPARR